MAPAPEPPVLKSSASRGTAPQPDIDSKMRLYGAIAAMRRSRLPTNAQITDALDYVKARSPVDEKKLSSEGRKLVGDIRDILSTFSGLLQEKNKGEILQRFVWETRGVDTSSLKASEGEKDKGKEDLEKAKRDAQEGEFLPFRLSVSLAHRSLQPHTTCAPSSVSSSPTLRCAS
jgi:hypothetical protein